jgi:chromosome segregation ATPase
MEKISGGATDFDDALYLSQEALNALQGSPKGVECEKAKDPWKPYGQTELEGGKALLQKVIQNNLEQINVIVKADKELDEHKKKEAEVKDRVEKLKQESAELKKEGQLKKEQKKEKPLPPPQEKKKGGDDAIAKYEEQKAFQKQEEEKIKEVARKQKEKQEAYEKALAAMRELQRVINQENGRKKGATDKLQENKAKVGEIVRQLQVNTGGR